MLPIRPYAQKPQKIFAEYLRAVNTKTVQDVKDVHRRARGTFFSTHQDDLDANANPSLRQEYGKKDVDEYEMRRQILTGNLRSLYPPRVGTILPAFCKLRSKRSKSSNKLEAVANPSHCSRVPGASIMILIPQNTNLKQYTKPNTVSTISNRTDTCQIQHTLTNLKTIFKVIEHAGGNIGTEEGVNPLWAPRKKGE